jgi:hypothetical protein
LTTSLKKNNFTVQFSPQFSEMSISFLPIQSVISFACHTFKHQACLELFEQRFSIEHLTIFGVFFLHAARELVLSQSLNKRIGIK